MDKLTLKKTSSASPSKHAPALPKSFAALCADLEQALDYSFRVKKNLEQALTHSSFGAPNNERLEFLGDSIVDAVVSKMLFAEHLDADEGLLSRMRSHLVREDSLADLARTLGLPSLLRLSLGERRTRGTEKPSILADAFEALMAAIWLEAGFDEVDRVIRRLFAGKTTQIPLTEHNKDAKTRLQEWLQKRALPLPVYEIMQKTGQDHSGQFLVRCQAHLARNRVETSEAWGSNRRQAEQGAAQAMWERLNQNLNQESS